MRLPGLDKGRRPLAGLVAAGMLVISGIAVRAAEETKSGAYPLDHCVVSGQKLGSKGEPVVYNYKGREIKFCCKGCVGVFEKDPAKYIKMIDEAIIKQQTPTYPLTTCPVTGDKLGGKMGKPVDYVYNNRLVRFCCPGCIAKFEKNPQKYLSMIDEAAKKQQSAGEHHEGATGGDPGAPHEAAPHEGSHQEGAHQEHQGSHDHAMGHMMMGCMMMGH